MRELLNEMTVKIPADVKCSVKSRVVTVTGPRGVLKKDLRHIQSIKLIVNKDSVTAQCFFGKKKQKALVRTVISLITNMFTGVTVGYRYKMRLVYAHFPISMNIEKSGDMIELRNFLGEKLVRRVEAMDGAKFIIAPNEKETLYVEGNSLEGVAGSAARVQQSTTVKEKDIRKFLDGIYVSVKENVVMPEE